MIIAPLAAIAYGSYGLWRWYRATHNPKVTINQQATTYSTDQPDETRPPADCSSSKTKAKKPERIKIESININGCIVQIGIDQHGAVAVPGNIYLAGWYTNSALPGQAGLSIIDGHIRGRYKDDAIFQNLHKVKTGDIITIAMRDGQQLRYKAYSNQSIPVGDATKVLFTKDKNIAYQLNLITCGGAFNNKTNTYEKRVIVSAVLMHDGQ